MDNENTVMLLLAFLFSWFLVWLIIVRPICKRLDRIIVRVANMMPKHPASRFIQYRALRRTNENLAGTGSGGR
jgi:hypothetical protein